ncbi:c-type cytochrome [Hydrogenophaga sp. 5NK40-0174]|uniref:c-type cytochrome n=1 Tax=Hydrogenophaga sp. 5NK40-0174 TaxID=3127649 RepID=UPI00310C80FF
MRTALTTAILSVAASMALSSNAFAVDEAAAMDLAKASGCMSCHAKDKKVVGPAFVSIAEKYAGEDGAAASLAQSVRNGSKGKWGRIPMPSHSNLKQEDLDTILTWVLSLKK